MSSSKIAIGIDLGTTNSCVAVYRNGKINVITNPEGSRITPSQVSFNDMETLVGEAAKRKGAGNAKNTIFNVKRLIGRKYHDRELEGDLRSFPFEVVNEDSHPLVQVATKYGTKRYTPEEISAMILGKMKDTAEQFLGHAVQDAVITVPAYFNDGQRQATKDAATIAGLNVLRIINEPTAAALAYGLEKNIVKEEKVLIFDLGGGTFDVSILNMSPDSVYEVLSTTGDTHFGGTDFDQRVAEYIARRFKRDHGHDISRDPKSLRKLQTACEVTKRSLSNNLEDMVIVDALFKGIDIEYELSRLKFEELCEDYFDRILGPVKRALEDAKLHKSQIDEVVLIGGSTRIPKIRKILGDFFEGKILNNSINPDEAVAYGAAAKAAILSGVRFNSFGHLILHDVTPLSLGIEVEGRMMGRVVARNSRIPLRVTRQFTTVEDYQDFLLFEVYEGESAAVRENHKLGQFKLLDITPLPRGRARIDVTFEIDDDGILTVTAVEAMTGKINSVTIRKGRLDPERINQMIKDAEKPRIGDRSNGRASEARRNLESYVYKIRGITNEKAHVFLKRDAETLRNAWRYEIDWLEMNRDAKEDVYDVRYNNMKSICEPIIRKLDVLESVMSNFKI